MQPLTNDQLAMERIQYLRRIATRLDEIVHEIETHDATRDEAISSLHALAQEAREGIALRPETPMPIFVLKPSDPIAPAIAQLWLAAWRTLGQLDAGKVADALSTIEAMSAWQRNHADKVHIPD